MHDLDYGRSQAAKILGMRRLAYHAPASACLAIGILAALLFSGQGIGSLWIGLIAGSLASSVILALVRHVVSEGGAVESEPLFDPWSQADFLPPSSVTGDPQGCEKP
jgi:hypothetical protein